ncbi:MAG: TonB-dependent hemoglobin/transferrin/lactoferrin family receptor [Planctomycetota bacterium]
MRDALGHRIPGRIAFMIAILLLVPLDAHAQDDGGAGGEKSAAPKSPDASKKAEAAGASTKDPNDPARFGEIIVTATLTERSRDLQPNSTQLKDRQQLDDVLASDIEDVLRYLPGVTVADGTRTLGQSPNIRGLQGERVLNTIDGGRLTFSSAHRGRVFVEPNFLRSAEIIAGPSSALQGSNALGGAFNMRTLDPSDILRGDSIFGMQIGIGLQTVNDEFNVSPIIAGRLAREGPWNNVEYLFGYTGRFSNDIALGGNLGDIPFSALDRNNAIAKVVWSPTSVDRLAFRYLLFDAKGDQPRNGSVIDPDDTSNLLVDRKTRQHTYGIEYERRDASNPWVDLRANVYFNDMRIDETVASETSPSNGQADKIDYDTFGVNVYNTSDLATSNTLTRFTYGVEYYRDEQEATRNGGTFTLFPDGRSNNLGLYAQAEIMLWDNLVTIVPGLRWDYFDLEATDQDSRNDNNLSPKIGALVTLDDEINLADGDYLVLAANYADGFRAPTFSELFISGTHFAFPVGPPPAPVGVATFIPNPDLDPETSQSAEASLRFKKGGFRFRGVYYRTWAEDFIELQLVQPDAMLGPPFGLYQNRNVANARIWGYELEVEYSFQNDFRIWGNYSYVKGTNETDDQPLATIPPDFANLGFDYTYLPAGVRAGFRVRIFDSQKRVPDGEFQSSGYTLYDLFMEWRPSGEEMPDWARGFRLTVSFDNLTDKAYVTYQGTPGHGFNVSAALYYTATW